MLDDPERVTPESVRAAVGEIRGLAEAGKHREAHDSESILHVTVLGAIARGIVVGEVARECANEANATIELEFDRWPERNGR